MGYIRHHGMLVTAWDENRVTEALNQARSLGLVVTEALPSPINGYVSFAVLPDGSKEGWTESDKGDAARAAFKAWLQTQLFEDGSRWFSWVEVQYGDDNGKTRIVSHSDEDIA